MSNCKCSSHILNIKVKYHSDELIHLEKIAIGDWVDLRSAELVNIKKGESKLISLGIGMKLPDGYEANIVPRSSTASKFGVLQTNHFGVIDNSYSGNNDVWKFPAYAIRDTQININDRICQFRLNKVQPQIKFEVVDCLDNEDRGGFGSTGVL